jgi:hypothetical protein
MQGYEFLYNIIEYRLHKTCLFSFAFDDSTCLLLELID